MDKNLPIFAVNFLRSNLDSNVVDTLNEKFNVDYDADEWDSLLDELVVQ